MTEFTTFRDAAEAARKMAIENQQTIYVFRVREDTWGISTEPRDSGKPDFASRDTDKDYLISGKTETKPETASSAREAFPF